jgi:3-methyl-2-oxobutanoate hydroxymethyltransferase
MRTTVDKIRDMKMKSEKIAMLTAYDYVTAKLIDELGIPLILVGDSLGMVVLGYRSTIPVTMDEMIHHTKAVIRGADNALVVGDMPFMTYHVDTSQALRNAARFIQEGGAQAVKLEGGESVSDTVASIVQCGIPVMGHIGLTPQSIHQLGGFRVQGKTSEAARQLLQDARALEEAGAFSVVLESVPAPLAKLITERTNIPTIGIGAGIHCDGQVQVINDILGLYTDFVPKHAKRYAALAENIKTAVGAYISDVSTQIVPTEEQSYSMDPSLLEDLYFLESDLPEA